MKKWIGILVALVVVGLAAFAFSKRGPAKGPATAQATAPAETRDLDIAAEAAGLVEPVRVVEVKSKASGEVLQVFVDTGDKVEKGAPLAEIDPRDVQSALEQAQADVESARVKAEVTEAHRQRMVELRKTATVTQEEYEASVDAAAAAKAAVVRNETALRLAKERRGDVSIKATEPGTILSRSVQPGQIIASATTNVSGGTTLFTMADLTEMQVRAKVDESDIGRVAVGQTAKITVEAYPGRNFPGTVAKVEPQAVVEQNVTLFPVLIRVDNKDGLLRPGMNSEVSVEIASRHNVVAVPSTAVVALKDAVSAGQVLGVDAETVRSAIRGGQAPGQAAGGPVLDDKCTALRDQVRAAGGFANITDEQKAALRECFQKSGGGGGGGWKGGGGRGGSGVASGGSGAVTEDGGPAVLFIEQDGKPEPRKVSLGLSDWEYTEVKSGLTAGEKVVLVSVAQLQQQQQQSNDRMRQRVGGIVPGSGGGGARTGGGGR